MKTKNRNLESHNGGVRNYKTKVQNTSSADIPEKRSYKIGKIGRKKYSNKFNDFHRNSIKQSWWHNFEQIFLLFIPDGWRMNTPKGTSSGCMDHTFQLQPPTIFELALRCNQMYLSALYEYWTKCEIMEHETSERAQIIYWFKLRLCKNLIK